MTTTNDIALERHDVSGAYRNANRASGRTLTRFTVFVSYPFDPAAGALDIDAVDMMMGSVEEIDVDAFNVDDADNIARAALERDYEAGGRIVSIVERIAGWGYM